MKNTACRKLLVPLCVLLIGLPLLSYADGLNNNEVQFSGTVSSVTVNGEGVGTVFVRIAGFDLRVVVNSKAEVLDKLDHELALSDLKQGDVVDVTGKYSSSGILASKIQLAGSADTDFELRGRITAVQPAGDNLQLSLLGITVIVTPGTKIEAGGAQATISALKTGVLVQIVGTAGGSAWTAGTITILTDKEPKAHVRFEGTITLIPQPGVLIKVKAEGVTENSTDVTLNSNTRVTGELAVGASVLVIGILNPDLSVTATEVRVLQALEIKPDERKLKIGQTGSFTVKLRETANADTDVTLSSSDKTVLLLAKGTVTVLKGSKTAEFTAQALKTGIVTITAEALGQKATAEVQVGEVSEEENERPAGETRIAFAPSKIKMGLNDTRDVVLLIKPPQEVAINVDFTIANKLVTIEGQRTLGIGAAELKLTIQSGSKEGTESVAATLPQGLGGGKAELLVEISAAKHGGDNERNAQIDFHPGKLKLAIGESATVKLQTSVSFDEDVIVTLEVKGSVKAAEAPLNVTIPAGKKSAQITLKGAVAGQTDVIASLPKALGGDTAELRVEVK